MKILSYNIQAAINSSGYISYSYQWPRQLFPTPAKKKTLKEIAQFLENYDVICLQEIDLGGFRNGFQSQRDQLLSMTPFRYDLFQINRRLSKLSLHGNLILSRYPIKEILNASLPSRIPGRGVLAGAIDISAEHPLIITNAHLSLGKYDQYLQLRYIRQKLKTYHNVLICGDLNTTPEDKPLQILTDHGYKRLGNNSPTFPSWKPQKTLDHALLKGNLSADAQVLSIHYSDHLPLEISIDL
ncbi:endonuclease/exonuclease/phosphatase family protein [Suttonella ornithocola]|uniref:Uncharacterized protein conserved in bacteria n=1 Tax=Suttonella ornithocola TaxID=279832 RepID=A0A380MYD9_9GAMM|nr:endonuclease/exonuclease/phosphatase family protein [Suttonella ornithocola]SUO97308.1 Uncharacterized protein conserved in bacteria [Suttonella ornithocola]